MSKLPSACSEPGCPEIVTSTRCPEHRRQRHRTEDRNRLSASERGYDAAWRKVRDLYFQRSPFCERCEAEGRTEPGAVVHHIVPVTEASSLRLSLDNLETLCHPHHNQEHSGEG